MKLTKRKGFNFFRSYYDVYNELNDKEKVRFMDALLDRQFLGTKPTDLKGMAKFAYISQTNSIDSQIKGYEDKTGEPLKPVENNPCQAPYKGGENSPYQQEEGEVQVQGEVQEKVKEKGKRGSDKKIIFPFDSEEFKNYWEIWKDYKLKDFNFKYKSESSEQAALKKLSQLANFQENLAIEIIEQSLANGWKGFFKLEKNGNSNSRSEALAKF